MIALQKLQQLIHKTTKCQVNNCWLISIWNDSKLDTDARKAIQEMHVEFHNIFFRHRLHIGTIKDFKVKLTPIDENPAYSQSLPTPINLKGDIPVELSLLHKNGNITSLPFNKYASPLCPQRKPNGKLRHLADLRNNINLTSDDYINNNHPLSTLTDAAQKMAGSFFCKLDCSQVYNCLQMADQRSVELLEFNFVSRTLAYRRLHNVSANHYQLFQASCANTSTLSSKQTNANNMLMTPAWPQSCLNN